MLTRVNAALRDFLKQESAGGIVLIAAALMALVIANSPFIGAYQGLLDTKGNRWVRRCRHQQAAAAVDQ